MRTDPPPRRRKRLERVFPTRPGAIPTRLFAAAIRDLLNGPRAPSQAQLQARSGVPTRTIYRVLNHVDRSVSFEVADALLTALDAIHLWHQPPLDNYLQPPPPHHTLINPITHTQAAARQRALARHAPTTQSETP